MPLLVQVTEQGEVIQFKYALHEIVVRNLELYAAGTLERTLAPPPFRQAWREVMQELADRSLREDPRFVPYFRAVTPENGRQIRSSGRSRDNLETGLIGKMGQSRPSVALPCD